MSKILEKVDNLYNIRFSEKEASARNKLWKVLCNEFLQKYIHKKDTVLDVAAGYCNFINNISCKKKIAVDINPEIKVYANKDVEAIKCSATKMPKRLNGKVDVVFVGCFLEHLPSKEDVFKLFTEVKRVLKKGGTFMILNPNIRLSTSDYWDYFDHLTAVSDRSVTEGLMLAGFKIEKVIPGLIPNTIKDSLPKSPLLVKIYLHLPFLFPIFGRQMFIVAKKP